MSQQCNTGNIIIMYSSMRHICYQQLYKDIDESSEKKTNLLKQNKESDSWLAFSHKVYKCSDTKPKYLKICKQRIFIASVVF